MASHTRIYDRFEYGMDSAGGNWFEWGNYFSTETRAKIDFIKRTEEYMETHNVKEKLPTAAADETPPDAAGGGKKPSVMEQIKASQNAPRPPLASKQEHDKKQSAPEL